jgi:hypothetical protein
MIPGSANTHSAAPPDREMTRKDFDAKTVVDRRLKRE